MMQKTQLAYAHWIERLLANLLDTMILLAPSLVIEQLFSANKGPLLLILFALNVIYVAGFLSSHWQATPGKRIMRIYVIHADRSPLTLRDAVERYLAYILPSLPIYTSLLSENTAVILMLWLSMLWFIPILTTPEHTGIHDKICRTRVVKGLADAR